MARSDLFHRFIRTLRIADACNKYGWSSEEGVDRANEQAEERMRLGRRKILLGASAAAGALTVGCSGADEGAPLIRGGVARSTLPRANLDVAIVGAGLAGLSCANELKRSGITATIYEANSRTGGRCFSMGGAFPGPVNFPGQVIERGGELIDTPHKTMIGYAQELGLALEDVEKGAGDVFYRFDGIMYPESQVVDEYRVFVDAMRDDLRTLSGPTADAFTPADQLLDNMTLRQYLDSRGAGSLIKQVIEVCYNIEYGVEIDRLSALAFLLFIHADRRSRFQPWGVFSDERYHVVGGNQSIPQGLTNRMSTQLRYGRQLLRVAKRSDGRIELTFQDGSRTVTFAHDAVCLAIPFSVLRGVELDASLGLPAWKRFAIDNFQYGTNAKMMVGFQGPFWRDLGSNGASYSDMAHHQCTWETNPSHATATTAVLTNYTGGNYGASLDPSKAQLQCADFLTDLDKIYPGALARAAKDGRNYRVHIEAWPKNPLTQGSYSANAPGYFTTVAGNEGKPVGNLYFAGEHTDSFYVWQGFMEGACLSGIRAAGEIVGK